MAPRPVNDIRALLGETRMRVSQWTGTTLRMIESPWCYVLLSSARVLGRMLIGLPCVGGAGADSGGSINDNFVDHGRQVRGCLGDEELARGRSGKQNDNGSRQQTHRYPLPNC